MNKVMRIFLILVSMCLTITAQATDDLDEVSASVSGVECYTIANGSKSDGRLTLGYVPTESQNAVVMISEDGLINSDTMGSWAWFAPTAGVYTVSHCVGGNVLSATYTITNGYVKAEDKANPPMELIESITISPTEVSAAASGGRQLLTISGTGEVWTASTSVEWLTLNSTSGTAEGKKVVCTIAANENVAKRVGYVYVAGHVLTVTQEGRGATLDKEEVTIGGEGGEAFVTVSATDETSVWNASSDCPWISVLTPTGTGTGKVRLLVAPWNRSEARTGIITVLGLTVPVSQTASQFVCPTMVAENVVASGKSGSFDVATVQGIAWSAKSDVAWLVVEKDSVTNRGDGVVAWTVQPQALLSPRTATITVTPAKESGFESWTFTVTQDAAIFIAPEVEETVVAEGESGAFQIETAANIRWTATSDSDWLVVDGDGEVRSGAGRIEWTAKPQTTLANRTAMITAKVSDECGDKTLTLKVTQIAAVSSLSKTESTVVAQEEVLFVDVAVVDGVNWFVENLPEWILLEGDTKRVGAGTAELTVLPNQTFEDRSATFFIAGIEYRVTQEAAKVTIVGSSERYFFEDGADEIFNVRVDVDGAPWTIDISEEAYAQWIFIMDADGSVDRTGDGSFELYIDSCSDVAELPRTAMVTIGDQTLTITQMAGKGYSTITYANLKGAMHANPSVYQEGTDMAFVAPGAIAGYTFTGWTPTSITKDMTGAQTVSANWGINHFNYTIRYNGNGGDGQMNDVVCDYHQVEIVATNGFNRKDYIFKGWATTRKGDVVYEPGAMVSNLVSTADGIITLYAAWEERPNGISAMTVAPNAPLGIVIDFYLKGVDEESEEQAVLTVEAVIDGVKYTAKSLSGETDCVNGAHRIYWDMVADGINANNSDVSITLSCKCKYVLSKYCVIDLSGGTSATTYPVEYPNQEPESGFNTDEYKTTKLVLKRVEVGTFIMGDNQTDESHRVTLTKPFYMGLFEVTQKQWELVMGSNPSKYTADAMQPVERVSYDDIRGESEGAKWPATNSVDTTSFLGVLRSRTGIDFDLPTEAQWEYTCRAGTTTTYNYGDDASSDYMWYESNSSQPQVVGLKASNEWGFYDMHGNVGEWCLDWYGDLAYGTDPVGLSSASCRVHRGGTWSATAKDCTASSRWEQYAGHGSSSWGDFGFRLAGPGVAVSAVASAIVSGVTVGNIVYTNLRGATHTNSTAYNEGTAWDFTAPSEIAGYTFVGWTPAAITEDMTGVQTVRANWKANSYTIQYDSNGGDGKMESLVCEYDQEYVLSSNEFTRGSYLFLGWSEEKDGDVLYRDGAAVSNLVAEADGVLTLYAKWDLLKYQVLADGSVEIGTGESGVPAISGTTTGYLVIPSTIDNYSVTSIGSDAFYGCSKLSAVTVPEGVTNIGENAFYGCASLQEVVFYGAPPKCENVTFPSGAVGYYYSDYENEWKGVFGADGKWNNLTMVMLQSPNVWRYYAKGEEGNPTGENDVACIAKKGWVLTVLDSWGRLCFDQTAGTITLDQAFAGEGVLDLRDLIVEYSVAGEGELSRVAITGLSFDQGYPWANF